MFLGTDTKMGMPASIHEDALTYLIWVVWEGSNELSTWALKFEGLLSRDCISTDVLP